MKNEMPRPFLSILACMIIFIAATQDNSYRKNLLLVKKPDGSTGLVVSPDDWYIRRGQIIDSMQAVMGPLPPLSSRVPPDMEIICDTVINNVRRHRILFSAEKNDRVPAYLLIPLNIKKPVPGILCLHQTTRTGKGEPAGLGGNPNLFYALELAERGYVTLAPDYPGFGDYGYDPYSGGYVSATMKGIWNHMAAVSFLQSLHEVDKERIGCVGHSLGGHNSLFLAAFDTRVKAVVTSCGFTSFCKYYGGDLTGWSHKGYMPRIASVYGKNPADMPFDFTEVLGAIAPRALFINAPLHDSNFSISGVHDCVDAAEKVYKLLGAEKNLLMVNPDAPHDFPPEARTAAWSFLDKALVMNDSRQ